MQVLNNSDLAKERILERPKTAALGQDSSKRTLGSACPVIIKHDFPNEQNNYIDNLGQEMSSVKKRFLYDRPFTAKTQRKAFGEANTQSATTLPHQPTKRNSTSAGPHSQLNSAELYNKLLEGQKIKKEQRFVIKPARKLNTFQIHSALFKIKKQKEELDGKIRDLEDLKNNFNEMDFYLIANSGAVDYMFKSPQPVEEENNFLSLSNQDPNDIPSLGDITENSEAKKERDASQKQPQKGKKEIVYPEKRPKTSLPKTLNKNSKARAQTAKASSKDEISMLRDNSRDQSKDQNGHIDLEILGNCTKFFQQSERNQVQQWGQDVEQQDGVKDTIDSLGQSLTTINRLLSGKKQNGTQQDFHKIQEEVDDENDDLNFQSFEALLRNNPVPEDQQKKAQINNQQPLFAHPQIQASHAPENQYQLQNNQMVRNLPSLPSQLQQQQQQQQIMFGDPKTITTGIYPSFSKKSSKNSIRAQSASVQNGLFRPVSGSSPSLLVRPSTAAGDLGLNPSKTSYHALMTYGPVQLVKERITRNFDHLDVLTAAQNIESLKKQKQQKKEEFKQSQMNLKVAGSRLPLSTDQRIDLDGLRQEAMLQYQLSQHNDPNFFNSNVQFDGQMSQQQSIQENSVQHQKSLYKLQQKLLSNSEWQQSMGDTLTYSQASQAQEFQRMSNYASTLSQDQLISNSRAAIDLNQMQKDQSLKLIRPSTAKQQNQPKVAFQGQLNIPFSESIAFKHSEFDQQQQILMVSGHGATRSQLYSHDLHQIASHSAASQNGVLHQQEQLLAAAQNFHNIQNMQMAQSIETSSRFPQLISSDQIKNGLQLEQTLSMAVNSNEQKEFIREDEAGINEDQNFDDDNQYNHFDQEITVQRGKQARPQTAALKR